MTSSLISSRRLSAWVTTTNPSAMGIVPPLRFVPAPLTVSGIRLWLHSRTTRPSASPVVGRTTRPGITGSSTAAS